MRGKLLALVAAAFVAACTSSTEDAASSEDDLTSGAHVLSIGDSITFAWNPQLEKDPSKVVAARYRGFADLVSEELGATSDNMACPGETSSHFVRADGEDNGCAKNRATYKLHYDWGNAPTQLDAVTAYLRARITANNAPKLVTMTLGGNDLLRIEADCKLPGPLSAGCELVRLPFREHSFGENIKTIVRAVHGAGYRGKMVFITTYAPNYSDAIANLALTRFNGELKEELDGVRGDVPGLDIRIADAFAAFKTYADQHGGKTCETGLLISNGDGTCDIHPTLEGHKVLAQTILDAAR